LSLEILLNGVSTRYQRVTLAGLFSRPMLLLSSAASYAAVHSELAGAEVFHFAGHAISDGSGGALLLAGPSGAATLGAPEIEQMPLQRCRLAVLSACTTSAGDGAAYAQGLAGAFLRAGAWQVVAVRWKLERRALAEDVDLRHRFQLRIDPSMLLFQPFGFCVAAAISGTVRDVHHHRR
jgi:CHAT domain-containing protein